MSYVTDGDDQGESRADLDAFILIVWLTGLVMKCMWGVEWTRIVPRFLAWAVGWMEMPFTEIGKRVRKAGKARVGKQQPGLGLVQFESLLDFQVTLSRRQMDLCVSSSAKRSALES